MGKWSLLWVSGSVRQMNLEVTASEQIVRSMADVVPEAGSIQAPDVPSKHLLSRLTASSRRRVPLVPGRGCADFNQDIGTLVLLLLLRCIFAGGKPGGELRGLYIWEALFDMPAMRRESSESLLSLVDGFERNISILKRLGEPAERWSSILVYQLSLRLDNRTLREWEHYSSREPVRDDGVVNDGMPLYIDMIQFLQDYARVLQSIAPQPSALVCSRPSESKPKPNTSAYLAVEPTGRTCLNCGQGHFLGNCGQFRKMSPHERLDFAKTHRLCLNCLKTPSHSCKSCPSSNCRKCDRKHNTLLHLPPLDNSSAQQQSPNALASNQQQAQSAQSHPPFVPSQTSPAPSLSAQQLSVPISNHRSGPTPSVHFASSAVLSKPKMSPPEVLTARSQLPNEIVLLWTAIVNFEDCNGTASQARILLDCGSQCNFMTEALYHKLKLAPVVCPTEVAGIGSSITRVERSVAAFVSSRCSSYRKQMSFLVLPSITRMLPSRPVDITSWELPRHVRLADPTFNTPGVVDAIVGNDCFADILRFGKIDFGEKLPVLQKTAFGWIVSGTCQGINKETPFVSYHLSRLDNLEALVERFWELESCSSGNNWSASERDCEQHFRKNVSRDSQGRYVVKLPKKEELLPQLQDNRLNAQRRFLSLEHKLDSNNELKHLYHEFIHEYISLGHMLEVPLAEIGQSPQYFLPHHAVLRPDSSTTKLRTVFDASCKSQSGISLNDVLLAGPTIQDSLISIVMRFRMHAYVVSADIAKMYRQILVHPDDQALQRIYWRDSKDLPLKMFQLRTVTYGTNSASFLATRVLQQLAEDEEVNFPLAAPVVRKDFYMDDLLTGSNDLITLKNVCVQVIAMLDSAGFPLRKFSSNSQEIIDLVPEALRETKTSLEFDSHSSIKTLGLIWEPSNDFLSYKIPDWPPVEAYTKRTVLSRMSSLFDPLGLLSPIVVKAKIFMQTLWKTTLSWDTKLPSTYRQAWEEVQNQIPQLKDLRIPRHVLSLRKPQAVEMHGFSDASEQAYGACVYIRSIAEDGYCTVRLVAAKSRIAPLEVKSIARLELCAALLLANLVHLVAETINYQGKVLLWTDSSIVLHWLSSTPSSWQTFVANRVAEIQRLTTNAFWKHVPSCDNPADLISRGMNVNDFYNSYLWWNGPPWIATINQPWPESIKIPARHSLSEEVLEVRKQVFHVAMANGDLVKRYSSYTQLLRIGSLCRRFANNSSTSKGSHFGPISNLEMRETMMSLVRAIQSEFFATEIVALSAGQHVPKSSSLRFLHPSIQNGLIRVGGRLEHAEIDSDRKHPLVLPERHPFTLLVAESIHRRTMHGGPQLTLAIMKHEFWPLRGRNLVRRVVHSCVTCAKAKPRIIEQLMGQLPPERVNRAYPFQYVGVDFAGPVYLKPATRKGAPIKAYVAVFVCLAVKAAHLELVSDLTSAAFIAALRRFIARRGLPSTIFCDNATNFTAAQRELKELRQLFLSQQHRDAVLLEASTHAITFHFIPPQAPTFGGLWEACVKSFKHHLRRVVGNSHLSFEAFSTVLAQIEACLNSRPITPMSADPNDVEALTPGHFLVGRPLLAVPEPDLDHIPENRLDLWQKMQRLTQHFWKRWHNEYLSTLQLRYKWSTVNQNLLTGSIVLVRDDNLPVGKWSMGRVLAVHFGDDDLVRVATVKVPGVAKPITRPITKLCYLPIEVDPATIEPDSSSTHNRDVPSAVSETQPAGAGR
ncbi:uncharacterized protein LOC131680663 [Topomyia yanbarensis]|uniref:uncharacterized protein LOC131680663 n=1 Tax=Topomyia yanbarensis TaxID=2498891 RepID=UPI00273CAC15|nr:uncharacterized protein LOC131680663 [Topomyia yanbarensis]